MSVRTLLALNAGSTSLKAARFSMSAGGDATAVHEIERISIDLAKRVRGAEVADAIALLDAAVGRFSTQPEPPTLVAHRIVHGGDHPGPIKLTQAGVAELATLSALAPLHQPIALAVVQAATQRWPGARQVGVFDTSWHRTMPERHRMFAVPHALFERGVKRHGFHGIAFQSAMRQLAVIAPELARGRIVLAHLGGGGSLCAVRDGRSVSTTMGMTPLDGIPMSTRPGSLDPGVLLYLQRDLAMSPGEIDQLLWHECGLKGLSGESGDMRELLASGTAHARRAIAAYVTAVAQGIAGMAACVHGLDGLVFSGGIGANASEIRQLIVSELAWLGVAIDPERNAIAAMDVTAINASVKCFVLPVDETLELALAAAIT